MRCLEWTQCNNLKDLEKVLVNEWSKTSYRRRQQLFRRMPDRIRAVRPEVHTQSIDTFKDKKRNGQIEYTRTCTNPCFKIYYV